MALLTKISPNYFKLTLLSLVTLTWWSCTSVTPYISLYIAELQFNTLETSVFFFSLGFSRLIFQPLIGYKIQSVEAKKQVALALGTLLICSLIYLLSHNFWVLLSIRVIEGWAVFSFTISIRVIINNCLAKDEQSVFNGWYAGARSLGAFVGPILSAGLVTQLGLRAIFLLPFFLYILANLLLHRSKSSFNSLKAESSETNSGQSNVKLSPYLKTLVVIHFIEFIGMGLWYSAWSIYAVNILAWDNKRIGWSYACMAFASLCTSPFLSRFINNKLSSYLPIGLSLLAIQPLIASFHPNSRLIWLSFIIGGMGSTIYFTSFHSLIGKGLLRHKVAIFYGYLGTLTYFGQSLGQAIASFIWKNYSAKLAILLDATLLIIAIIISIVAKLRFKTKY